MSERKQDLKKIIVQTIGESITGVLKKVLPDGYNFALLVYAEGECMVLSDDLDTEACSAHLFEAGARILKLDADQARH